MIIPYMEPEFQNQHKLSQIYLKQFGYIGEDNEHYVSVYRVGEKKTMNIKVKSFTAEVNIFDLPLPDMKDKRLFENLSSQLESRYPKVITNLKNQKKLIPLDKDILNNFTANILCRTDRFRDFISWCLKDSEAAVTLVSEITLFSEGQEDKDELEFIIKHIPSDLQLNLVMPYIMTHLVQVFRRFKKVVLKHYANVGWLTSDNPVHIERFGQHSYLIPVEAEIYFPLSKDFCLFMFHPDSQSSDNLLRKMKLDKVNLVNFGTCDDINKRMFVDNQAYLNFDYLIFNTQTDETTFRE
ncbi:DUF4238 domain-containing protein [Flavobacterium pectinovorum]|uniref:DUF4238 domain-containing protein n=1 Tax=Flavobacterium pectinovorum TaxID=29533 RepID=A0A502F7K7_9FLAO|nr:DUF4238 domain-containing protein [Flavobacterium pectinovorum]TPG45355.1 DUF4238 domain-containing protein [Flavobacterium pectinovorum]